MMGTYFWILCATISNPLILQITVNYPY